jgi:hypothetical protein
MGRVEGRFFVPLFSSFGLCGVVKAETAVARTAATGRNESIFILKDV